MRRGMEFYHLFRTVGQPALELTRRSGTGKLLVLSELLFKNLLIDFKTALAGKLLRHFDWEHERLI